jgi:hypothetical protein
VIYMHATAKEFISQHLEKTEVGDGIEGGSQFPLQFLSAYVLKMKRTHMTVHSQGALIGIFDEYLGQLMWFAKRFDTKVSNDSGDHTQDHGDDTYFQILDECRRVCETPSLSQHQNLINRSFKQYVEANLKGGSKNLLSWDFLSMSVEFGLEKYMRMTLVRNGIDPNNRVKIMHKLIESHGMWDSPVAGQIIGHLLSHALDLPGIIGKSILAMSTWETLLHCAVRLKKAGHQIDDITILLETIPRFKGLVHERDRVLFLTYNPKPLGPHLVPFWQGSTRQVLSGLLKLPESVVVPLIGVRKVDGSNTYFPELPEPGLWKVETRRELNMAILE